MLAHSGHLQHILKLVLAPASAGFRLAQGLDEPAGLGLETRLALAEDSHLLRDGLVGTFACLFDFRDPALKPGQAFADWLDQGLYRPLAVLQVLVR